MVKLLMQWDIMPGSESGYLEFITTVFTPRLGELGLELSEVWYTYWGNCPQLLIGFVAPDLNEMERILSQSVWRELRGQLQQFVANYQQKVVEAEGAFQL